MGKVKELRELLGKKQEFMADFLGISVPNYCKKESGSVKWSLEEAGKLSDFFGKTIEDIFFENKVSKNDT